MPDLSPKLQEYLSKIEYFCVILGNPRTGSTLVEATLDAHPKITISCESQAFAMLALEEKGRNHVFPYILEYAEKHAEQGKNWTNYTYAIPGQWQGRFKDLRVIGDKLPLYGTWFMHGDVSLIGKIRQNVNIPVKFIHTVRNPFDVIATMSKKGSPVRGRIGAYFNVCECILDIRSRVPASDFIDIRMEDLIARPAETISRMCEFLGQVAPEAYLTACRELIFSEPNRPRLDFPWDSKMVELIKKRISEYDFLAGYELRDNEPSPARVKSPECVLA